MKKKIQVIKPTQRHKKRYVLLKASKDISNYSEKDLFYLFFNNLSHMYGFVSANITNLVLLEVDSNQNTLLFRVNKDYLDYFLGSLLFIKDLGVIRVVSVNSTIKPILTKNKLF